MLELMLIAVTKQCEWSLSGDARVFVIGYLNEHGLSEIESLQAEYNRAFGRSSTDGVKQMVLLFDEKLTGTKVSAQTAQRFYVEFYAILSGFLDDFKRIRLVV